MNKTAIKNFAIWARNKLIADISYRAGLMGITESGIASALPQSTGTTEFYDIGTAEPYAISGDAVRQRRRLVELIERKEKETDYKTAYKYIIEEVAYTWFNRLIAIRFMEVNDYLPSHIRVLSSESGKIEPDLVTTPFDADLEFTKDEEQQIIKLKNDNKIDELFKMLFIKQCNELNEILPYLFEKTKDYTELLLNISIIDQESVVRHLIKDIPEEDFDVERGGQVEIIGWLYQYYISEPKDVLINARKQYKKDDIPFVTQLFTSDWIVKYMVENSLGRMWMENNGDEELKNNWKYYIDQSTKNIIDLQYKSEELVLENFKIIDPCMGSGHILVYAFDILLQIYEKKGYSQKDAAKMILECNLYGLDIDNRAFQLAYFSVIMKARQYNRRILNKEYSINLYCYHDSNNINSSHIERFGCGFEEEKWNRAYKDLKLLLDEFNNAKEYGSIMQIGKHDWALLRTFVQQVKEVEQFSFDDLDLEETQTRLLEVISIAEVLSDKYDIVITNPPYLNSSYMPSDLKKYVAKNYEDFKNDLFAVFLNKIISMCKDDGHIGMLTPYAWMFISSFEKARNFVNCETSITTMVQLEYNAFEAACVPVVSFTLKKTSVHYDGEYIKLSDFKGAENQAPKTLQAIENPKCSYRYTANQDDYKKIPGSPIAYWIGKQLIEAFEKCLIKEKCVVTNGLFTCDNDKYLRLWHEISINDFQLTCKSKEECEASPYKWYPYNKGGNFRRWYGNREYVVYFKNFGSDIRQTRIEKGQSASFPGSDYYFKPGITYSDLTSGKFSCRYTDGGFVFDIKGSSIFCANDEPSELYILGLFNSCVANEILNVLNPTISYQAGNIRSVPLIIKNVEEIENLVKIALELSKSDWDSFEYSWDFKSHPLLKGTSIEEAYHLWEEECETRFSKLKEVEEQINSLFIDMYGLNDELSPLIEDKEITVRKADLKREIRSLISYSVGCMCGRYSLDVDGITYAGGTWNKDNYNTYLPDIDNVLPITDENYLEDDIVEMFCLWLKKSYGNENFEENLDYISKALGNKGNSSREIIRNYFLNDFIKDHIKIYQKRPIYWLFDSGRQNGFKALIYMHRYDADTIGNLRVDYLHRIQRVYESEINRMQDMIDNSTNTREISLSTKRKEKLLKQIKECQEYDEKISHLALSRIRLDLDDGVKCNYEKVQTASDGKKYQVLAKL